MAKTQFGQAAMGLAALVTLAAGGARADTIYQSATYTGQDTGEYILSENNLMGAEFHLDATTQITGIGGQFGGFPGGSIFGAIVPLSAAFPAGSSTALASIAVAHTVFAVPGGTVDLTTPLSVTLAAGDYAVIFGSGQFGATGFAGLGDLNIPVGSPNLIRSFFSTDWDNFSDTGVRITVQGVVPEPQTWALMIAGFGLVGGAMRARHRAVAAA